MNRFIVAGKEAAYPFCVEGDCSQVVASLYIDSNKPVVKNFTNKDMALNWIHEEVVKMMGVDYYGG